MFFSAPSSFSFQIVTDHRLKTDRQLDESEPHRAPHVLDWWKDGKQGLGYDYSRVARIALFDFGEEVTDVARGKARADLEQFLASEHAAALTVLLPTPRINEERAAQPANNVAWHAFKPIDSVSEMRGCFYEWSPGRYVLPLHAPNPGLKVLQQWQQWVFLKRALSFAKGRDQLLTCRAKYMNVNAEMIDALRSMRGRNIAVDIESIEDSDLVTAIGVSDGTRAVSIPWDPFVPYGHDEKERGLLEYEAGWRIHDLLRELLGDIGTSKAFHNFTFDVPRLEAEGLPIGGTIHDTFAAHAIAFPELKHGLQHACASLMMIRPWKSAWHPKLPGITRDDSEYWSCDAQALRDYNADDAYHTWHLAKRILPMVERTF